MKNMTINPVWGVRDCNSRWTSNGVGSEEPMSHAMADPSGKNSHVKSFCERM